MPKPIIILGAGASYDYSTRSKPAPLTSELVSRVNDAALAKYPGVGKLLSTIEHSVSSGKSTFEAELQTIKNESWHNPICRKQFVALEFYLQDFFTAISEVREPMNNYKALINQIDRFSNEEACVITFNYDSLFEGSFDTNPYHRMVDYINNKIKLIKLHGSHNWVYIQHPQYLRNFDNSFDFYQNNPDYLQKIINENQAFPYHIDEYNEAESKADHYEKFPAIAVPLQEKQSFICPMGHVEAMSEAMKESDRVLIIGWRGLDSFFADFFAKHIPPKIPITIVSKDRESDRPQIGFPGMGEPVSRSAEMIKNNLNGNDARFEGHPFILNGSGFSGFVGSAECKQFFR